MRLDRVGVSDGVLKGGSERGWKRAPGGRSCILSELIQQRLACMEFDVRYMQLRSLWGGVRIFGRGVRKKGGSDEPPLVTGLQDMLNNGVNDR